MTEEGFFSRWSRRKARAREAAAPPPEEPANVPPADASPAGPAPTMEDVERLTPESDYARFVARDVGSDVKRAALKKLFSDPHFQQMDGLDVYIGDYGTPDPIAPAALRQMAQARLVGLLPGETSDEHDAARGAAEGAAPKLPRSLTPHHTTPAPAADAPAACDENPAVQLQPDDAAGRPGPGEGAGS